MNSPFYFLKKVKNLNRAAKIILVLVLILATALVSSVLTLHYLAMPASQVDTSPTDAKLDEIGSYLEAYFIDEYDPDTVAQSAADGAASAMVEATGDRGSYYISADDMESDTERMNNAYVGVGITIAMIDEGAEITSVTDGGTAQSAGLQVGDVITKVEGQSTAELGLDGTRQLVRGEAGTTVHMTVQRDMQNYELDVLRAEIVTPVATGEMLDGQIGYITISNFDEHCAEHTLACMEDLMDQGAKALLFDVRFNGGGMKDEMVKVLDALLPEGVLFRSVDYAGKEEIDRSDASCVNLPMAVLVNEDSYSAAEFFAAALQEYGAAQVVGTQTCGKGNFQVTLPLSDGSAVALSVGKYFTPQGRSLTDVGVTPDAEVDLSSDEDYMALYYGTLDQAGDTQLQAALTLLQSQTLALAG